MQSRGINFERLYDFRFRGVDQDSRQAAWNEIAVYMYRLMGSPARILDPAAGRCEFINAVPAPERWIVDLFDQGEFRDPEIKTIFGSLLDAELPAGYFDGVFVSNFLEHLEEQEEVALALGKLAAAMRPGGRLAVMGPNFRYCWREYFDCADHTVALTHVSAAEHLHAAGFSVTRVAPRFLPYSFRGTLPASPALVRSYLRIPALWRMLGKQFLVLAERQ
jgi:SAM-dependent methyltransferase